MDYAMEYDLDAANIAAAQVQLPRRRPRRSVPRRACAERLYPLLLRLSLSTLHEQTRTRVSPNRVRNGPTRQCAVLRQDLCTIGGRGGGGGGGCGAARGSAEEQEHGHE